MSTEDPLRIYAEKRFPCAAERVFEAWIAPECARTWLFATESGEMVRAETDPRVGGGFCFTDRRDGVDVVHEGTFLEIEGPRRLVFTFYVDGNASDTSRVTIDIAPTDTGCELTLAHEMDPKWTEYQERTEAGWRTILDGLARALDA